jgi:transposase-like protein
MEGNSKYTEEFKIKVTEATLEDGSTLKSVGEKFGVSPTLVKNWRIKYVAGSPIEQGDSGWKKFQTSN